MFQLIYVSAAKVDFSAVDLRRLLLIARRNNGPLGVTGMLLYHEGSFLQVLEGDEDVVLELFEKIQLDPRHTDSRVLLMSEVEQRSFADWRMGFCDTSRIMTPETSGFVDFFRHGGQMASEETDLARRALLQFRQGRWRQFVED